MYQKTHDNRKTLVNCAFLIYILGVLCLTFIVRETMVLRTPENRGVVLDPLREFEAMLVQPNHKFWFMQIFLNVLLFVPFGALLPCVAKSFRNPVATVFAGFLFSSFIETMQYITGRGLTEVDDVITNTMGAAVGYVIFAAVMFLYKQRESEW